MTRVLVQTALELGHHGVSHANAGVHVGFEKVVIVVGRLQRPIRGSRVYSQPLKDGLDGRPVEIGSVTHRGVDGMSVMPSLMP